MQRLFFLLFLLTTSCGYHWGKGQDQEFVSMNVPYAKGDLSGTLTAAIIRQISESSLFAYDSSSSALTLKVSLREAGSENIGYRHDRNHENHPKKSVLPTEGREKIQAEVMLVESGSEKPILGPFTVEAEEDFDFITQNTLNDLTFINAQGMRESVLRFSMGQLEPLYSAQEAARKVAEERLAKKIVHLMMSKWKKIDGKNGP